MTVLRSSHYHLIQSSQFYFIHWRTFAWIVRSASYHYCRHHLTSEWTFVGANHFYLGYQRGRNIGIVRYQLIFLPSLFTLTSISTRRVGFILFPEIFFIDPECIFIIFQCTAYSTFLLLSN